VVAERINEELKTPFNLDGRDVFTTVSIGIAQGSMAYDEPDQKNKYSRDGQHEPAKSVFLLQFFSLVCIPLPPATLIRKFWGTVILAKRSEFQNTQASRAAAS
jgi:hypothetical protein